MRVVNLWKFLVNSVLIVAFRPIQYQHRIHLRLNSDKSYFSLPIAPTVEQFDDCMTFETVTNVENTFMIPSTYHNIVDPDIYELKQKVNRQVAISLDHLHEWEREEIVRFLWSSDHEPSATNLRLKVIELTNLHDQVQRIVDSTSVEPKYLMNELQSLRNKLRMTLGESTELRSVLAVKQFENHTGVRVVKNMTQTFQQLVLEVLKMFGQLVMTLLRPFQWFIPKSSDVIRDLHEGSDANVGVSIAMETNNVASTTSTNALDSDNHCTI